MTDAVADRQNVALFTAHEPLLPVTHESVLPGMKVPVTVTFGIAAPVAMLRAVMMTCACQNHVLKVSVAPSDFTAMVAASVCAGAPLPSEYTRRFGEPVPTFAR